MAEDGNGEGAAGEGVSPGPASAAEAEPAEEADATSGQPPLATRRWWLSAAAALFLACAVLAALAASLARQLSDERGDRHDVEEAAGRMASALLTYDHQDLDTGRRRVLDLSVGKFRKEYQEAYPGLAEIYRQTRARSTVTVTEIFVGAVEDDTASAIVVYDTEAEGVSGRRRTAGGLVRLGLVKVGGRWRVDDVTDLQSFQSPLRADAGAATTSSTAPGGPSR